MPINIICLEVFFNNLYLIWNFIEDKSLQQNKTEANLLKYI